MNRHSGKIDSTILLSANATLGERNDLFSDVATARWAIGRNSVVYEKTDSHTLSLYLNGGETSCRADRAGHYGGTGKLCLMPQGHRSDWRIGGAIDFAHVYFTDKLLKQHAVLHRDCDARLVELIDAVYSDDAILRRRMLDFSAAYAAGTDGVILAEQCLAGLLDHLVAHYNAFRLRARPLSGGLSPRHRHLVLAAIEADLAEKLTIARLAELVGLSPYHFARMFKISFGTGPAQFILRMRLERVKRLLATNLSLADVGAAAGFSQQSHMTTHFSKLTGLTPARYRRALA